MILRMYTVFLEPEQPIRFSADELRLFLNRELTGYAALHRNDAGFIHRYPVLQCKQIRGDLMVTGVCQGADCLYRITLEQTELGAGESACLITARDPAIRSERFGISDDVITYEFLTPWLALNQQHAKKFYDLSGKPQRDAFMHNLLTDQLQTLAKSLDYDETAPISCDVKVRFRRDRIGRENMMVFLGRFQTNLRIPDYLGIGRSVSAGFGTIKRIMESHNRSSGEP
jgi:hypothetical protein